MKTEKLEMWALNDPRLPDVLDRPKDVGYRTLVSSLKNTGKMIHPVCFGLLGEKHLLIAGRGRIMAARELEWKAIPVRIIPVENKDEIVILRIAENTGRSDNIVADFIKLKATLMKTLSYKETAEKVGMSEQDVITLDKKFGTVPDKVLESVVAGKVSVGTAIQVGKMKSHMQKKAVAVLAENGKLTGNDLHELKSVTKAKAESKLDFLVNTNPSSQRQVFNRTELLHIQRIAESECAVETLDALEALLK